MRRYGSLLNINPSAPTQSEKKPFVVLENKRESGKGRANDKKDKTEMYYEI